MQGRSIAVVHRCAVNAAVGIMGISPLLVRATLGLIRIAPATTPVASPASAGGGMGRSDDHTSLTIVRRSCIACVPNLAARLMMRAFLGAFYSAALLPTLAAAQLAQVDLKIQWGWKSLNSFLSVGRGNHRARSHRTTRACGSWRTQLILPASVVLCKYKPIFRQCHRERTQLIDAPYRASDAG